MTFVEDSATQSWGERSICSPAYFFNGLLTSKDKKPYHRDTENTDENTERIPTKSGSNH